MAETVGRTPRDGFAARWEEVRSSFGFPSAVAMLAGLVAGFGIPAIDRAVGVDLPVFQFTTEDAARGLLETIATVSVAVAGLSFSITVVAFTLAANQLSPRVLRTFRADRLSRMMLACLLGTFIYCLGVLVRLGVAPESASVPNLAITVAVLLALGSFGFFAIFIAHIVEMLQPSSIIAGILGDARRDLQGRLYPSGVGDPAPDAEAARVAIAARVAAGDATVVSAEGAGFLTSVRGAPLLGVAREHDALVVQRAAVGDYILPGEALADLHGSADDELAGVVRDCFELGDQRTPGQDLAFTVRQLADIALKGLSPGVNDPTTAETAMDAMAAILIGRAREPQPSLIRVDDDGRPRLVARTPSLDDLTRLGFEQVRGFAEPYPVVGARLVELLDRIAATAAGRGVDHSEATRQRALLRERLRGQAATPDDGAAGAGSHVTLED